MIEIVNNNIRNSNIRCAVFDFDGTISLIRANWQHVMSSMMVELLLQTPHHESREKLKSLVTRYIEQSSGAQTIHQMSRLCEEIRKRGGTPKTPEFYKSLFLKRLHDISNRRILAIKNKRMRPEEMMIPGIPRMLRALKKLNVILFLTSGADKDDVIFEAQMLGIGGYFENIYAAADDNTSYSKESAIKEVVAKYHLRKNELVMFGDGVVDIQAAKSSGSIAVGVASNEADPYKINEQKREYLIKAGADIIIPNFIQYERLLTCLLGKLP